MHSLVSNLMLGFFEDCNGIFGVISELRDVVGYSGGKPRKVVFLAALLDCFGPAWVFSIFTMAVLDEFIDQLLGEQHL